MKLSSQWKWKNENWIHLVILFPIHYYITCIGWSQALWATHAYFFTFLPTIDLFLVSESCVANPF